MTDSNKTVRPWTQDNVVYKPTEFPCYFASSDGRIVSSKKTRKAQPIRTLTAFDDSSGYLRVHLSLEVGQRIRRSVHSLVARAFHGERPPGCQVCHINGNRKDNQASNLRWGTAQDNANDRAQHGRTACGTQIIHSRLTEDEVRVIKCRLSAGERPCIIARDYPVSQRSIRRIKHKITWAHIQIVAALRKANPAAFEVVE